SDTSMMRSELAASWILLAKVRQERGRSNQTRCCARDGGRPSEVGLQEQASNIHKLRWSKARVVSVMEKARLDRVMCRSRRRTRVSLVSLWRCGIDRKPDATPHCRKITIRRLMRGRDDRGRVSNR